MANDYDLRVFRSIDAIDKDQIDSISNDSFFTYGWFKTLEEQKDFEISPFYVAAYKQDNLVAFVPCFIDLFDHFFYYGPYVIFPFMKRLLKIGNKLGLWQKHVLLCYSPFCFRSKVLVAEDSRDPLLFGLIIKKINEICRKERILFSSFLFVSQFDNLLAAALQKSRYSKFFRLNTLYLDVPWSSFEVYLVGCKYETRKDIRREIKKFSQSGLIVENNSNIEDLSERLSLLHANLSQKYNSHMTPRYGPSFFESLNKFAGDKIRLFTAKKGSTIVAYCLALKQKQTLDCYLFGSDYSFRTNTDFAYFNLAYYEPIKWSIQEGIKRIFFRFAAENVKLRIGCKKEKIYSNVKCHNRSIGLLFSAYVTYSLARTRSYEGILEV